MLWKKESGQKDAMYVDLFESPSVECTFEQYQDTSTRYKKEYASKYKKSAATALDSRQKGNERFAKKEWTDAMEFYNKSMCFAEEGSELMGLAYANRSSCFFNMKMYSKCLVDIELAKDNNYPPEKLAKLEERTTICLSMMEKEPDQSEVFEPKLDYTPNEMFPCFADVLKINYNSKHGRHIVATEDIEVGKTVMVDESYFAETFTQKYRRCGTCLRAAENLKPCNECTFTMHCSKCEGSSFHGIECGINPIFWGTLAFSSYRMVVVRSILLAMNTFDEIDQLVAAVEEMLSSKATDVPEVPESLTSPQSKYRAFFKLQPNAKSQMDEHVPRRVYLIYQLLKDQTDVANFFHSEAHKRFLLHLIGHHVIIIKNWIRNDRYKTGQKGIFSEDIDMYLEHRMSIPSSYFNHSCAPNAYITSQNGINICVVVRPVRKGEQLCVTYDELIMMMPKAERQEELREKFNFHCNCDRCLQPRIESATLNSNYRLRSDPNFLAFSGDEFDELAKMYSYENVLSLKAKAFHLLTKYKTASWSDELLQIIYRLYSVAIMETEGATGGIPFMGNPLNMQHD